MKQFILLLFMLLPLQAAANFSTASEEYINVNGVVSDVTGNAQGTIYGFANLEVTAANQTLFSFGDTDANEFLAILFLSTGRLQASCADGGAVKWVLRSVDSLANGEQCLYLIHDGSGPKLYRDGVKLNTTFINDTDSSVYLSDLAGIDNACIGALNYNAAGVALWAESTIWDWRIYSKALPTAVAAALCVSAGADKNYTLADSCYARWPLDEFTTGATVIDISGNGNHGTPVNNPTYTGAPVRR